ncbi:uncharacterized protein LOC117229536 [Megalopta genalis]|uniref:uncharacterized protein LOC117229536 n=1 Tax=Megalopta genalis TaxID=115081 RepID=UPI003FD256E4
MGPALLFIVLGLLPLASAGVAKPKGLCKTVVDRPMASLILRCTQLTNVKTLDRASRNLTAIEITDSEIPNLPGFLFVKFRERLAKLDLHGIGIQTIDQFAFRGLTNLQELLLWGNKLEVLDGALFAETPSLKVLDVSFNQIQVIHYQVFMSLPNLESFYFDYNQIKMIDYSMLAYLKNLKNVKFEKNPLNWGNRAHLTWQLDNQRVKYTEEWEDWAWMNAMIKECAESGHGEIPKDTVLDCVVGELLDFAHEIFSTETRQQKDECAIKAGRVARCMRPRNVTGNTDNETVRRILEGYAAVLVPTTKAQGRFSMRFFN